MHDDAGGAAHGTNGQRREEERHRTANQQTDEHLGVGDVDGKQVKYTPWQLFRCLNGGFEFSVGKLRQRSGPTLDRTFDEGREDGHGADYCRADGETFGDGLRGVTNGIKAHHDPFGVSVELARHFGDASRVVGNRSKGVFGDDHAGGGKHSHAAESNQVETELKVSAAERQSRSDRDGDGDDRIDGRLESRSRTGKHNRRRPGAGRLGNVFHRLEMRRCVVLGQSADQLRENESDHNSQPASQADVADRLGEGSVI